MHKNLYYLPLVAALSLPVMANAAPRTKAQMQQSAHKALQHRSVAARLPKATGPLKALSQTDSYTIFGYENGGFAVVSADDLLPEVLGVSASTYSQGRNEHFNWWLQATQTAARNIVKSGRRHVMPLPEDAGFDAEVPSMVTSKWDQQTPYNNLCPGNKYDRCLTGCVATAMAQVLNYHKMPEHGQGERMIFYPKNNQNGEPVYANFAEHYYDWNNMLDVYVEGQYNEEQAEAVAMLMRDCGVAADMEYGTNDKGGSAAYSVDAAAGLRDYFGLSEARSLARIDYGDDEWMSLVYGELSQVGPICYGGGSYSSGGHEFVLDGYRADGMVSVNWGWSGEDNGYYDISLLNPSLYRFDMDQDMIIGLKAGERIELMTEAVNIETPGTLMQLLDEESSLNIGTLTVSGLINADDLARLRYLAGMDENGDNTKGHLETLDLTEARFVTDDADAADDGRCILPEKAFYGCRRLKSIKLPKALTGYGDGALALCPRLKEVEITAAEDADFVVDGFCIYNRDTTEIVAALPMLQDELVLPRTVKSLHNYALAGCSRLEKVVLPVALTAIGREALRKCSSLTELRVLGKDIPELGGDNVFTGVPFGKCQLFVRSGMKTKFSKTAQWSDFADKIVEFGTTIKARNAVREYGEDNPTLGYQMKGDRVKGTPVLTCDATPTSPAGRYTIHIEPGTITDEAVDYEDGYLVVQKAMLTVGVQDAKREQYQADPDFVMTFEGFRNGDDETVIDVLPTVTSTAERNSPAGEYALTAAGGEDDCYDFTYASGTLTVTRSTIPTAIQTVAADRETTTYDLQGRRILPEKSQRGVTIVRTADGKAHKVLSVK